MRTNDLANAMNQFMFQALDRVCHTRKSTHKRQNKGPRWYDKELRPKRSAAVKAGERAAKSGDNATAIKLCKEYRSDKQRKKRNYKNECLMKIEKAYSSNPGAMWKVLNEIEGDQYVPDGEPSALEFYDHFCKLAQPIDSPHFDYDYEKRAIEFLDKYDADKVMFPPPNDIQLEIINSIFTEGEILNAIYMLKNKKSPGIDGIPAEVIKYCQDDLVDIIKDSFNYIIENRDFPDVWAEGLRSTIFKSGARHIVDNFTGIIILCILQNCLRYL